MNEAYIVYGLEDPRDYLYHYIGITTNVYKRFNQHITGSGGNIKKNGWIFECRQANIMIIMREIERVQLAKEAEYREQFWIEYFLHRGHPLQNDLVINSILREIATLETQYRQTLERKDELEARNQNLHAAVQRQNTIISRSHPIVPEWRDAVLSLRKDDKGMHVIADELNVPYNQVRDFLNLVERKDKAV